MGEIADMMYDQFIDQGGCPPDEDEGDDRVTCRRCGAGGLHWQEIVKGDGTPGHALFNERNRKHECAGPDTEGFEVVNG